MKKLIILLSFLGFFAASPAFAAVALNATSSITSIDNGLELLTVTSTASGANRYVIASMSIRSTGGGASTPSSFSFSYDGVQMQQLGYVNPGNGLVVVMFGLANPNTTANAVVSSTMSDGSPTSRSRLMTVEQFTGASGSTASSTYSNNCSPGCVNSSTVTIVSATGDMTVDIHGSGGGGTMTPNHLKQAQSGNASFNGDVQTASGASSVVMTWTYQNADLAAHIGIDIQASAAAAATGPTTHLIRKHGRTRGATTR